MDFDELRKEYESLGYDFEDAEAKICQDIILLGISKSKFKNHTTIKGGVVIHNISNDKRRATRDLDLDFIKYSLEDNSIINFINIINDSIKGVSIEIIGRIKPLHHHDYDGKRVLIKLNDSNNNFIESKIDIGVEKNFDLEQEEYSFNLDIVGGKVNLLINSKEQIFCEKLKSLLKLGFNSTRFKDLFDFYYFINETNLDIQKLYKCIDILIFKDVKMRENSILDIVKRLELVFNDEAYKYNLSSPKVNWLDIEVDKVIDCVINYMKNLEIVGV